MDHRLRWRDCVWRMGDQDVMRLCSTLGRYVTSLEIRHFWELPPCARWHNLAGSWETNQKRQRFTLSKLRRMSSHHPTAVTPQNPKSSPCPWKDNQEQHEHCSQKLAVCGCGVSSEEQSKSTVDMSHEFGQLETCNRNSFQWHSLCWLGGLVP